VEEKLKAMRKAASKLAIEQIEDESTVFLKIKTVNLKAVS